MCCVRMNKYALCNGKHSGMAFKRANSTFLLVVIFITIRVHCYKFEADGADLLPPNSEQEKDTADNSEAYICDNMATSLCHTSLLDCIYFSVLNISDDCATR
jgi:hypothetical protein